MSVVISVSSKVAADKAMLSLATSNSNCNSVDITFSFL